jgi:hypothetical protein
MKEGESAVRMVVEWWGMVGYWPSYGHFGGIWKKKKKMPVTEKKNVWQGRSLVDVRRGNWIGAMF